MSGIVKSFQYAIEGLKYVFSTQRNLRIHFLFLVFAINLGWVLKISKIEWLALVIISCIVICLEIINTAIEVTIDLAAKGYNIKAKIAKDAAAGAVFLAAVCAVIIGIIIFLPKIALLVLSKIH